MSAKVVRILSSVSAAFLLITSSWAQTTQPAAPASTGPATTAPVTTGPTDVLEAIPSDTWGFVIVRDMQALSNDAVLLGQKLGLPVPPVLPMAKALIGLMEGVNDTGSLALVVGAGGGGVPPMGLLVPVTDVGQMIGYLAPQDAGDGVQQIALMGKPTFVVPYGGFAVMAPSKEVAMKMATASAGVRGKLDEARLGVYQESDLFAHVELAEVLKTYRPMVEMMIQSMSPAPTTQPESGAAAAPPNPLKAVFDIVLQLSTVDVAANLDAAGLMIQGFLSFLPGSDLAVQSAAQELTDKPLLVGLPAMGEQYIVAMGSLQARGEAAQAQMVKGLDGLLANPAVAQHIDPAQGEKLKGLVVAFTRQVQQSSLSISALPTVAEGLIGFAWVLQVEDAAKTAGLFGEVIEAVKLLPKDEAVREDLKNIVYKPKAEQVGDLSVDHVLVDMANLPEVTDADRGRIKSVAGQDGLLVRIAAVGDNHVVVLFGGGAKRLAAVAALSAQGQSPLSTDPGIRKVADKLPTMRAVEMYFSLDSLMQLIKSIGEAIEEPAPFEPTQAGVPAGLVVSGGKTYSRMDLFVPTELMVAVKDLAMQVMGGMTGTPGAPPTMPVPAPTPTF
ncbi:MAG TPA: hypothetical protein VMZ31_20605 [Phycisphaerae bacterium]|nr:hypothetical protein [Phycisphaerae bacterium]